MNQNLKQLGDTMSFRKFFLEEVEENIDNEFDSEQLEMGIETEKEHGDLYEVLENWAKENKLELPVSFDEFAEYITKAHLKEIPDYYTRLQKMEKDAKNSEEIEVPPEEAPIEQVEESIEVTPKVLDLEAIKNRMNQRFMKENLDVSDTKVYKTDIKEVKDGDVVESYGLGFGHVEYISFQSVVVKWYQKEMEFGYDQFSEMIKNGELRVHRE